PQKRANTGKREPHPPTSNKTLTKNIVRNYCSSSKKPPPQQPPTQPKKAERAKVTMTGQNKLIRRL
ncbi:hypothetical protein, partial [Nocardioides sp.]|uniref:hypothetical protein n=1 Tax=Nocardioides sp. TaxID=35761 RepID=UPI002C307834